MVIVDSFSFMSVRCLIELRLIKMGVLVRIRNKGRIGFLNRYLYVYLEWVW